MLRLAGAPQQTVRFLARSLPPDGLGEPGVPPALDNAI
jgi:CO/xanthine dehydrogenase Mo-binding subunit